MKRIVYHGTDHIIEKPLFGYGERHNDYGLAFYCAENIDLAKEWACKEKPNGIVNKYEVDIDSFRILDLTDKNKYSVLNWIAIILHFRDVDDDIKNQFDIELQFLEENYYIDVEKYDVIIGYRADDAYFRFPQAFIRNEITVEKLEEVYLLGDLEKQISFKSERSFMQLLFVDYFEVDEEYHQRYIERINKAKKKFSQILNDERRNTTGRRLRDLIFGEKKR
ncbi:MAG: DUF3990 domain-containing protein [Bacilli bacterium]|nr:DUF3990 domain-containing protein [Bacilli bacterium]